MLSPAKTAATAAQATSTPNRATYARFVALAIALVTLLAYAPVVRNGFIHLDDDLYVTKNGVVQNGLTWAGTQWAFTTWHASNWHPLTWMSHMLDCSLYGLNPGAHHYMSVVFHAANAVVLLFLLYTLTSNLWPSALAAALFAFHPLMIESVAWVAERKNVLSTLFGLLALLAYAHYARADAPNDGRPHRPNSNQRVAYYIAALFSFMLSLLAKPALVTLPCVMLLLDYWPLRRAVNAETSRTRMFRLTLEKWPFFLVAAGSCLLTVLAQSSGGMVAALQRSPLGVRLCNACLSYVLYPWKAVCPVHLAILYPYPSRQYLFALAAPAALVLLAVSWLAWRARRTHPYALVGWLWFLGTLVPMIGIVQVGGQAMNDHHAYVPLIGIFVVVAFYAQDLFARFQHRFVAASVTAGLVLGCCLGFTEHQLGYWRTNEILFRHALAVTRANGPAHNHLGVELATQGHSPEAKEQFEKAIEFEPLWADPHNNLGNLLRRTGQPEQALNEFTRAVQLKPNQPVMRANLGEVLAQLGRYDEALAQFDAAAKLDPRFGWAHLQTAKVLLQLGREKEAVAECRQAATIEPGNSKVLAYTARLLSAEQNPELRDGQTAVALALRACALSPGDPEPLDILGMAFAEVGDFNNALTAASNAVEFATALNVTNIEDWKHRLELYRTRQPWREPFSPTNGTNVHALEH